MTNGALTVLQNSAGDGAGISMHRENNGYEKKFKLVINRENTLQTNFNAFLISKKMLKRLLNI